MQASKQSVLLRELREVAEDGGEDDDNYSGAEIGIDDDGFGVVGTTCEGSASAGAGDGGNAGNDPGGGNVAAGEGIESWDREPRWS